jgi:hypothetical protein
VKPGEMTRVIELLAEAKTHWLIGSHTLAGSDAREREAKALRTSLDVAMKYIDSIGGRNVLPSHLAVALRVCEMGLEVLEGSRDLGYDSDA